MKLVLNVFGPRYQRRMDFELERVEKGWQLSGLHVHPKAIAPDGGAMNEGMYTFGGIYDQLINESIHYPASLSTALESLHVEMGAGLGIEEAQAAVDALGRWIDTVTGSIPREGIWARL